MELSRKSSLKKSFASVIIIFSVALIFLVWVYTNFPDLDPDEYKHIKLPTDIEDAKNMGRVLSRYKDKYFYQVLFTVVAVYIFLQTFAVPGSIFLSILSGYLFWMPLAMSVICFCSAMGATFCYLLSSIVGRPIIQRYFPERVRDWKLKVDQHRNELLYYMIFLRITPFLPNWFINIVSPILGVSLRAFWFGTFIGVAPPSFLAVQAGTTLYQLTSSRDAFTFNSILMLCAAAIVSLLPILFRKKVSEKFD